MEIKTDLYLGDSKKELKKLPDNSVDLIVTSPPYADQRKNTYGGIHPDNYVEWFLPIRFTSTASFPHPACFPLLPLTR